MKALDSGVERKSSQALMASYIEFSKRCGITVWTVKRRDLKMLQDTTDGLFEIAVRVILLIRSTRVEDIPIIHATSCPKPARNASTGLRLSETVRVGLQGLCIIL